MGSKSKIKTMKSYENIKRGTGSKLKEEKKENALDIISKSLKANYPKGSGSILINL